MSKISEIDENNVILSIVKLAQFTKNTFWKTYVSGGVVGAEYQLAIEKSKEIEEDIIILSNSDLDSRWDMKRENNDGKITFSHGDKPNPWYNGDLTIETFLKALEDLYDFWGNLERSPNEEEFIHYYDFLNKTWQKNNDNTSIYKRFDDRKFHKSVISASRKLFFNDHYSQAIFEACKKLNKSVQKKSGLTSDGKNLMNTAFSPQNPKLKLNPLKNQSDLDEQTGFMEIYAGVMLGIRNPKGHEIINIKDPEKTLEYLSLISLLFRRLEKSHK